MSQQCESESAYWMVSIFIVLHNPWSMELKTRRCSNSIYIAVFACASEGYSIVGSVCVSVCPGIINLYICSHQPVICPHSIIIMVHAVTKYLLEG